MVSIVEQGSYQQLHLKNIWNEQFTYFRSQEARSKSTTSHSLLLDLAWFVLGKSLERYKRASISPSQRRLILFDFAFSILALSPSL